MKYSLPEVRKDKKLNFEWFPTRAQCFIYRNWGTVTPLKMSEILKCTEKEVLLAASDMGLDLSVRVSADWVDRGYITLIRNNWHLLDYDGLCALLNWDKEYLAFILQEDDFLSVKLGGFKPYTENPKLEALSEAQRRQTQKIKSVTQEIYARVKAFTVAPFDFFANTHCERNSCDAENQRFKRKIIYSYCALYGDTFADRRLIDLSFPEKMLDAYSKLGITGIWTQGVLSKLAPYPFVKGEDKGYKTRLDGMNYLAQKLARHGMKLYLYFNEPRAVSEGVLAHRDDIRGHVTGKGLACLCVRTEQVQQYLKEAVAYVVRSVPGLGGIYTITASENQTNCLSKIKPKNTHMLNCPHCKGHTRAENFALVNQLICEGAKSADPNIDCIAFGWEWGDVDTSCEVVDRLDRDISVMNVSETRKTKRIGGVETTVVDYSMSVEGPGEFSKTLWKYAFDRGHSTLAKIQVNNTWELSTVPYIPVFDKIYNHIKGLVETGHVDGLMLSWTLGGYPSPVLQMVDMMSAEADALRTPRQVYDRIFKGADIQTLTQVFGIFSDAFDEYPFHVQCAYNGPQQSAPANLLYKTPTDFSATMVCNPYDDLKGWSGIFPVDVYVGQIEKMVSKWQKGFDLLSTVSLEANPYLGELYDVSLACLIHFRCMLNQCKFVLKRENMASCKDIIENEAELAFAALELIGRNATVGYESSNHYFYTAGNLMEKIINCQYLLDALSDKDI
ncbi:MAG: hypothetical protein E7585_02150 [Ruminococcaceae bacterium]|nr:hypothetical protein [Oscillospiraceae bacterium]